MFDETNYENQEKANYYIRKNILNQNIGEIDASQQKNITIYNLIDLIDFEKIDFEKQILLTAERKMKIQSKWQLAKIEDLILEQQKSKFQVNEAKETINGIYNFFTSGENVLKFNEFLVDSENIYLSTGGNAVIKYYNGKAAYSTDTYVFKTINDNLIKTKFIYYFLESIIEEINQNYFKGVGLKHLQKPDFKNIKMPLPDLEIQNKLITEIENIEKKESESLEKIELLEKEIFETIEFYEKIENNPKTRLIDICEIRKGTSITKDKVKTGNIPVIAGGSKPAYYHNEANRTENIITVSASGSAGLINFWTEPIFASDCTTLKALHEDEYFTKLIYYFLKNRQEYFFTLQKGQGVPHVYAKDFQELEIPFLSKDEQKLLIEKIEFKEKEILELKNILDNVKLEKENVIKKYL